MSRFTSSPPPTLSRSRARGIAPFSFSFALALAFGLTLAGTACTSSTTPAATTGTPPSNPAFDTSVDGTATLASLGAAAATQFCRDLVGYAEAHADATKRYACSIQALVEAGFADPQTDDAVRQKCASTFADCEAKDAPVTDTSCAKITADFGACTATVADVRQCWIDAAAFFATLDAAAVCSALHAASPDGGAADAGAGAVPTLTSAACTTVEAKCPHESPTAGAATSSSGTGGDD